MAMGGGCHRGGGPDGDWTAVARRADGRPGEHGLPGLLRRRATAPAPQQPIPRTVRGKGPHTGPSHPR
jgi:hypothetical protein